MWVLAIYSVMMLVGSLIDVAIGGFVSHEWSDAISLPIFLGCYFVTLGVTWKLAVMTAEKLNLYT